ncbi:MAG: hypothetical protein GVY12_14510 [Bacteroidetes bacterium]|nr:hypothetical protein [Bacteroidota bacterium]
MDAIKEKILVFHSLSADEQAAVRTYVAEHPEWEPALALAEDLTDLLQAAQGLTAEPPSQDMLAHLLVAEASGAEPLPPAMADAWARAEEALAADPAYREHYEALVARLKALSAEADPAAHFARLSGHTVEPAAQEPAAASRANDRPPTRRGLLHSPVRFVLATVACILVVYGALWGVSELTTPTHERLAAIDTDELYLEGFNRAAMRSGNEAASAASSPDALYLQALEQLRGARTSILGLFPRYDDAALSEAEGLLNEVIAAEEVGSFVQLDAYYFLGKIHLARGDKPAAREALLRVVRGEGRNARAASDILQHLAADEAYDPNAR